MNRSLRLVMTVGDLSEHCVEWLLKTQHTAPSVLTDTPAGGWGVSDALGRSRTRSPRPVLCYLWPTLIDGTAEIDREHLERAATLGYRWLLAMQNDDGGWPTFCRDVDSQPLDASGVDPTAQSLRALAAWQQLWKVNRAVNCRHAGGSAWADRSGHHAGAPVS